MCKQPTQQSCNCENVSVRSAPKYNKLWQSNPGERNKVNIKGYRGFKVERRQMEKADRESFHVNIRIHTVSVCSMRKGALGERNGSLPPSWGHPSPSEHHHHHHQYFLQAVQHYLLNLKYPCGSERSHWFQPDFVSFLEMEKQFWSNLGWNSEICQQEIINMIYVEASIVPSWKTKWNQLLCIGSVISNRG